MPWPPQVYIDGHVGTTGLRIREWMTRRGDVDMLTLPEAQRKNEAARHELITQADVAILCLPDEAAEQAAAWAVEAGTRVIDHQYGAPYSGTVGCTACRNFSPASEDAVRHADRVANPGCYPSAFLLLVRPLIDAGVLAPDVPLSIHALSGYSGGGREHS